MSLIYEIESGSVSPGTLGERVVQPTGIALDAEDPAAWLIEDVDVFVTAGPLSSGEAQASVDFEVGFSTEETGTPMKTYGHYKREVGGNAAALGVTKTSEFSDDNLSILQGAVVAAPYMVMRLDVGSGFDLSSRAELQFQVSRVEVPFPVQLRLWNQVDETQDRDRVAEVF